MPAQQPSTPEAASRRKTTLFCPNCGHESAVTGDWIVRAEDAHETYDCPVCDTTITKRLRGGQVMVPND